MSFQHFLACLQTVESLWVEMQAGDFGKILEEVGLLFDYRHVRAIDRCNFDRLQLSLFLAKQNPIVDRKWLPILPAIMDQKIHKR